VVAQTSDAPRPGVTAWGTADVSASEVAAREFVAWRAGEAAALDRLVRLVTPLVWHIVRAYRLDREVAEDVVQSTWLALVRHAGSIRDPQAVVRWVTTTARREAWRVSQRRQREDAVEPALLDAAGPATDAPDAAVLAGGDARTLWSHVSRLSERCRRLLRVIAFADRPDYASLSVQLGMPLGGLGPTRRRCLDKLRSSLDADPRWSGVRQ
jgi:RNA polymerase sigma factor (sigma-70 family)